MTRHLVPLSLRAAILTSVALLAACSGPPSRSVTLPTGRTVELLGVGPSVGPLGMMDRARVRDTVLLVRYIPTRKAAEQAAEREDLLAWAGTQAAGARLRYVALERREYPYGRLIPYRRGGLRFFVRDSAGAWVRYAKDKAATP